MDFQNMKRRQLQSLCKLNNIPANLTNAAMATALSNLPTVEGLEEFLRDPTAGDFGSPDVPRTTTRQKVTIEEPEGSTLTTRTRGTRRRVVEGTETKKTPATRTTRKKASEEATIQKQAKKDLQANFEADLVQSEVSDNSGLLGESMEISEDVSAVSMDNEAHLSLESQNETEEVVHEIVNDVQEVFDVVDNNENLENNASKDEDEPTEMNNNDKVDFHSLNRRDLQGLCKKNKIPANTSNATMADALASLENVEGLEEFLEEHNSQAPHSPTVSEMTSSCARRTWTSRRVPKEPASLKLITKSCRGSRRKVIEEIDEENTSSVSQTSEAGTDVCSVVSVQKRELQTYSRRVTVASATKLSENIECPGDVVSKESSLSVVAAEIRNSEVLDFVDTSNAMNKLGESLQDVNTSEKDTEKGDYDILATENVKLLEDSENKKDFDVDQISVGVSVIPEQLQNALNEIDFSANVFSRLISREVACKNLGGVKICRGAPTISHLFFADDSLIVCRANKKNAETINEVLNVYQAASGQRLNMQKSELFFSPSTGEEDRGDVRDFLNAEVVQTPGKYLGLPAVVGRNKSQAFNPIKERIWKKLKGWKEKLLSYAGREILIKAIAQAIPTYSMGLFKFPISLCSNIEGDLARFWWGHSGDRRQIYWLSWEKMCRAKNDGGLGYRHFESFNLAMLTKQLWRLHEQPNSLVARLLKARYFPGADVFNATLGHYPSFIWRSLMEAQPIFRNGSKWLIGDGRKVRFWQDKWGPSMRIISPMNGMENSKVADWLSEDLRGWNESLLRQHLLDFEVNEAMQIPIFSSQESDELIWSPAKNGIYTVKSGYHFIRGLKERDEGTASSSVPPTIWKKIWKIAVPPKVKSFIWRTCRDALPCSLNVQQRVKEADPTCKRCGIAVETATHALLQCPLAKEIWCSAGLENEAEVESGGEMVDWVELILRSHEGDEASKRIMVLWASWNARNEAIHGGERVDAKRTVERAICLWNAWQGVQEKDGKTRVRGADIRTRWKAPMAGWWKINTDAAILGDMGCGLGAVIRDSRGVVEGAGVCQRRERWSPEVAEAKAMEFGLRSARQMGLDHIILESDCMPLITMIKSKICPANYFGLAGKAILDLASQFNCI